MQGAKERTMPKLPLRSLLCKKSISGPLAIALIVAFTANEARAHHVAVGGPTATAGPINAPSADTLRQGEVTVALRAQAENYDEFSNRALEGFAAAGLEGVHNTDAAFIASLAFEYGVTDDLSIGVVAPYVLRYGVREGEIEDGVPEAHVLGGARGFGDLVVTARYRFLDRAQHGVSLSLLASLKTPTGESDERTDSGGSFETEFQPGSGSWDPSVGLAAGAKVGPFFVDASGGYTFVTEGDRDTNLGDRASYNLGLSYRIGKGAHTHDDGVFERHEALDLVLELNGEWGEHERIGAEIDPHSGGSQLFISPGLRYVLKQGWTSFVSVGFPLYEDLNGQQNETDFRATVGLGASF